MSNNSSFPPPPPVLSAPHSPLAASPKSPTHDPASMYYGSPPRINIDRDDSSPAITPVSPKPFSSPKAKNSVSALSLLPNSIIENEDGMHMTTDDGYANFEESVKAEEKSKSQLLENIKMNRERSDSFHEVVKGVDDAATGKGTDEYEINPHQVPFSNDFQRVTISNTSDLMDRDTVSACVVLKECMELREKWISLHPSAPQDAPGNKIKFAPTKLTSDGKPVDYRRRGEPIYDIFSEEVPGNIDDLPVTADVSSNVNADSPFAEQTKQTINIPTAASRIVPMRTVAEMVRGVMVVRRVPVPPSLPSSPVSSVSSPSDTSLTMGPMPVPFLSPTPASALPEDEAKALANHEQELLEESMFPVMPFEEFVNDFRALKKGMYFGPTSSYCHKHLQLLSAKFDLHCLLNSSREMDVQKAVPHRDFYNIRKVDTHVHHSACMNQKHLLRFIKHKLKTVPNEVVVFRDGRFLTLGEVFESLHLTAYDLSIDTLDMHANNTFRRFDRFNLKYNPAGQSRLREIFLKTDNVIAGRYLAEITKECMNDLEASKYQLVEWRISIYGRKASEWDQLARWFYTNRLAHKNVRWLIQIPRLYNVYKRSGEVQNFGQILSNIFLPLFQVSLDPSSSPAMHYFLQTVVGFDSVDDESRPENTQMNNLPHPGGWTQSHEPPYNYWLYYLYSNLCVLNQLRASRGLCTFQLRPHCGEAGDLDHLLGAYLLAHQINHGILLRKLSSLHYLYYLSQIGIAMSPLSNNKLFLDFNKNPFPKYFSQGMNVTLSTDDPLMLHYTKDPLVEEYSVAAQVWKLSSTDQSEIARRSVLQSGWEDCYKRHFLGKNYCDNTMTNVPVIRLLYRQETLESLLNEILVGAEMGGM